MLNNVSDTSKLTKKLQKLRPVNIITSRVARWRVIFGKFLKYHEPVFLANTPQKPRQYSIMETVILTGKYFKFG